MLLMKNMVCGGPNHRPESDRLSLPREFQEGMIQPAREEKCSKTDKESATAAANAAIFGLCRTHREFGARAWSCLGSECPLENAPGFLTKRGPGQRNSQGLGQGNGQGHN